jgi:hypothetical protein
MALGVFLHFALERVSAAVRGEQLIGTLESLLMTPDVYRNRSTWLGHV